MISYSGTCVEWHHDINKCRSKDLPSEFYSVDLTLKIPHMEYAIIGITFQSIKSPIPHSMVGPWTSRVSITQSLLEMQNVRLQASLLESEYLRAQQSVFSQLLPITTIYAKV